MTSRLYLDHAATTPMLPQAAEAVARGLAHWANPSSPHAEGRSARAALESARSVIRAAYDWQHELIFTSGATEAILLALGRAQVESRLIAATEHDSVLRAAPDAVRLPVKEDGRIDLDVLDAELAVAPTPALVAVQWGNSETGVIQPLRAIGERVAAAGAKLFVDAAQMPVNWKGGDLPQDTADLIAISAHKRGGPPGIGALLVRDLGLLLPTGGQERGYRGGTENVPATLGFAAAITVPENLEAMTAMRERLDGAIRALGGEVVAGDSPRAPHIASYRLPGMPAAAQLIRFDLSGISVSAGSACSSGSMRPSHVLGAMGWEGAKAGEVIRVSFGRSTTPADVERFISAWAEIARDVRARAGETVEPA
ncbi:aminotransferase class V-fold PLP-dependent enzyme [Sphingomonas cannabina]|uniref:cysteine desulfurase family protein n=1 Tax=Sphingomonas cannabina TaxID=2899123 RepID=UPI001F285D22|nr:aminotransferase class V-fold PLP-dependent enzyme [Sphingomonas cannabina]UIJ43564.1 aminotransferase class V-fold PLP-dependent enzyme [Sphingomonas cannabina]